MTDIAKVGGGVKDLAYGVAILAAVGLAAYVFVRGRKALTEDLNPASDKNIFYRAANAITQAASGDGKASVGTKLYDLTHSAPGQCDEAWLKSSGNWDKGYRCQGGKLVKLPKIADGITGPVYDDTASRVVSAAENFDATDYEWNYN